MFKLRISTKILISFVIIAVITLGLVGFFSYSIGVNTLEREAFNKLTAVREMKASQIEDYFQFISDQIVTLSKDRMIIDAMNAFEETHEVISSELDLTDETLMEWKNNLTQYYQEEFLARLRPNLEVGRIVQLDDYYPQELDRIILQSLYISNNPNQTGSKDQQNNSGDGSSYSATHEIYHPIIRDYLVAFGYYDIFLVDVNSGGHIVYSVFKEVDFGTSLLDGPYSNTNFGSVYRAALETEDKGFVMLVDFAPYQPSYNAPAAFIASPIFDGDEKIGVLIFQMPIDRINNIMTNNQSWEDVGLGESGETYIVGEDFLLRNQSRFLIEDSENFFHMIEEIGTSEVTINQIKNLNSTIGLQQVKTQGTVAALGGQTGTEIFPDYRGVPVFSAYKPLNIAGVDWVIMSEKDEAEVFLPIQELQRSLGFGMVGLFAVIVLIGILFSRTLTRPITLLNESAQEMAGGELDREVSVSTNDEIGDLAQSFEIMRLSTNMLISELEDANINLEQKVEERTKELELATERVRTIVEIAPDAVITIDTQQTITLFNPKAEEIFGYSADEVVGQPLTMLMPEKSRSIHSGEVNKFGQEELSARGMDSRREILGQRKDGSTFPAEAGISKMVINGEHYFTTFFRDITERRELEKQLEKANERMSEELNFAQEIQMSMLPLIFPAFPTRAEFNIYAHLIPAREVGGDFYDFYFLDEDHLCFVIGDVSGKGAPGALLMAVSKTLIKSRAMDDSQPSSILTHVNNELSQNNDSAMFVTVFLGVLNINTGRLVYCNAGHNPPFILRSDGNLEKLDEFHGPVIGALPNLTYKESATTLKLNDIITLHTDGVTEAMNQEEQLYTDARYEKFLDSNGLNTPQKLIDQVIRDVKRFEDDAVQADDITMLALQYHGSSDVKETGRLEVKIKNQIEELARVEEQFENFCEEYQIPDTARQKVSIVLDELLNNVVTYAFRDEDEHLIDIQFVLTGNRLVITIHDDGVPFNPFELDPPDISLSLDERSVGGLGIFLVRSMMDEFLYSRHIGKNVVRLVKLTDKD
jgi:PAS domain S-box-containing protein